MRSVVSFINSRLLSFYPSCSFLKRHCHSEQIKQAVVDQSDISILDAGSFKRLERLSALKMNSEDVKNLQDDISLSQKILHVNTENVEPLYNIVADYITCPLRDDIISENESKDQVFLNAKNVYEGFFTAPSVGILAKKEKNVVEM
ncbi:hypothetical protein ACQ4LE_006023 [Meloidogyne hapla]